MIPVFELAGRRAGVVVDEDVGFRAGVKQGLAACFGGDVGDDAEHGGRCALCVGAERSRDRRNGAAQARAIASIDEDDATFTRERGGAGQTQAL